jgi:hypothetical protein
MRGQVQRLVDEFNTLSASRVADGWDKYWRDCMKFALPQDVSYDRLLRGGSIGNVTGVLARPTASKASAELYDQTSLWAIERLTAGLITLKTPESTKWHGLDVDDPFGYEASDSEELWFDKLATYLFKVRSNPLSGFWPTHKAAVRSTVAMGDGFFFLAEQFGSTTPWRYEFVPLGECYLSVDANGQISRFFRHRRMTAEQIVRRWGKDASPKAMALYADPKKRQQTMDVIHAVIPRDDLARRNRPGVLGAKWAGAYITLEDKHLMSETGYWEMPYIRHSWGGQAGRAYSEGPLALALAEIKSLNEMAKNELVSSQQAVRPPLAVYGEQFTRINLNAGKVNAGLVSGDGKMLVQPIMTHTRPDFAQAVLETRRSSVREMLYLNLWQILIDRPDMTATEAMLRSQEKGELLGPVGISFNHSLATMVEREIAILARKGAFEPGQPLAAPDGLMDRELAPKFTAPLDRMRKMDEIVGAQRTVQGMLEVAAFDPAIMETLDVREYASLLRRGFGGPASMFIPQDQLDKTKAQGDQMAQLQQQLAMVQQGGAAAQAIGSGASALQAAGGAAAPGPAAAIQQAAAPGPAPNVQQAVAA